MVETRFRLSRKEVEREARKQDILDAAARLFAERGFHDVTMDQVADEVGLSKGTLYLYFTNKDDVFHTIVVQKTECLLRRLREATECTRPFVECLYDAVRAHCFFYQENVAYFRIVHSEMGRMGAESHCRFHQYAADTFQTYLGVLVELVKKGQAEGFVRQGDSLSLVNALSGILNSHVFHSVFTRSDAALSDRVEQIVDLFLNGAAVKGPQRSCSTTDG